jgi:hypothetical protein
MLSDIDLDRILDPDARALTVRLLNVVEALSAEVRTLREESQRLRDEINRLKGEQGKPAILPQLPPQARRTNRSSEAERREPREHRKGGKQARLTITRQEVLRVDRRTLPPDAVRKGYADVVFRTDTIRFRKEQWYARSTGQTYLAPLPPGYSGQFGPGLKSLALSWYYGGQMSEAKIAEVFEDIGIVISAGQLSNLLIKGQEQWHTEAEAIYRAGLASTPWQHLDERPTRVNGRNEHCHVLGNPLYTAYHTTPGKDRLSVLDVLRNRQQHTFRLNAEALGYLDEVGLAQWILDATAVAAYHAQLAFPVVGVLVCDDAPQFTWLTQQLALCWVHDGRHYKKLEPSVPAFRRDYWTYYRQLLAYRQQPTPAERERLAARFDALFSTLTGYAALDDRITKTRAKRDCLLLVLEHPELPLHNNPAELAARARVRKRDVSFGPRTDDGIRAWDTFATLAPPPPNSASASTTTSRTASPAHRSSPRLPHSSPYALQASTSLTPGTPPEPLLRDFLRGYV